MFQIQMNESNLYEKISQHDVISFDVFDTILCRFVSEPKELFELMNANFIKKYPKRFYSPQIFKSLRRTAEREARKNSSEITLVDIYNEMPWSKEEKMFACNLEYQLEKQYTYLNPDMINVINYCLQHNKRIILISDMYLSKLEIEQLLIKSGFTLDIVERIFVSSEHGVSKENGKLFEYVKKELNLKTFLHIGDNYRADFINAKKMGLTAFHYDKFSKENKLIFEMERTLTETSVIEMESARKVLKKSDNSLESSAYNIGAQILGPVYTVFSEWVINYCIQNKISRIRPIMREGFLFTKMLKKSVEQQGLSIKIDPIYISRKAAYLFDKENIGKNEIESLLWKQHFQVKNLFDLLGIHDYPDFIKDELYSNVEDLDKKVIDNPSTTLRAKLYNFLISNEILDYIRQEAKRQKSYFEQYIQSSMNKEETFVTVDLGYNGTIQTQMNKVLNKFNLHHLLLVSGEEVKEKLFNGMTIYSFLGSIEDETILVKKIKRGAQVLESVTNIAEGSTENYQLVNGIINPVLENIHYSLEHIKLQEECWNGIFNFQNAWLDITQNKSDIQYSVIENKKGLLSILYRFLTMPLYEEVNVISRLLQNESYKFTKVNNVVKRRDLMLLEELGIEKFLEVNKKVYFPYEVVWPEGVITLKYPKYYTNLHFKNYIDKFDDLSHIYNTLNQFKFDEKKNVYIYGAGEMGSKVSKILNLLNIKYRGFIDRNANSMNNQFSDKECMTLEEYSDNKSIIIIASFAYKEQIIKDIESKFKDMISPELISFEI